MKKFLQLSFLPFSADLALLVMRLWYGVAMITLHGWKKATGYSTMAATFSDPLGVGHTTSWALAVAGEVLCSALLVFGLFTRVAAIGAAITMSVAFFLVHQMALSGPKSGELAFVYLGVFLALLIAGPGRFSLDVRMGGKA